MASVSSNIDLSLQRVHGVRYPAPWFDIASTYLPPNITALMKWCRYYGTIHPVAGVLKKLAEYPITDLIWEAKANEQRETYREIFENTLNIKPFLVSVGMDYYTFGNCFISLRLPFRRYLECPKCKRKERIDKVVYEFKKFKFMGHCPSPEGCGHVGELNVMDAPLKTATELRVIRWEPENVEIKHNPLTGKSLYLIHSPAKIREAIIKGDRFILSDTPMMFIKAAEKGYPIEFNEGRLFHFKRPSLAGKDMGWGEPILTPVLKYLFYLQILMKQREASAQQGISPLKIVYPASQNGFNVYETLNLGDWKSRIEQEIEAWRLDPNRISVMPVPIGYEAVGSEHQQVNTGPEIIQLMDDIIAGMQIPKAFYYGGSPYSGTSAEFRMLENHFLNFQRQCLQFLNSFLIPQICEHMELPEATAAFSDLRVADDVQKKQLLLNLNTQRPKKISDTTIMSEFGLNADKEKNMIKSEHKADLEAGIKELEDQAEAQGRAGIIAARMQVKAQLVAELERDKIMQELMREGNYTQDQVQMAFTRQFPQGQAPIDPGNPANLGPNEAQTANLAKTLAGMPADQKDEYLKKLERDNPSLLSALMSQGGPNPSQPNMGREASAVDMRPLPNQKPPVRNSGTV